jgi:hypothetical protein
MEPGSEDVEGGSRDGQLQDLLREAATLREQIDRLSQERDAISVDSERKTVTIELLKNENDSLKHEVEKFTVQYKGDPILSDKIDFLMEKCKAITAERDSLLSEYRRISGQKKALELEKKTLREQCKSPAELEEELKALRDERNKNAEERNNFQAMARRLAARCKAMNKIMDGLKFETEEARAKYQDFVTMKQELDLVKEQCEDLTKEKNDYILKAHRTAKNREAIEFERDALRSEIVDLRARKVEAEELETQLRNARLQCEQLSAERDLLKAKVQFRAGSKMARGRETDALRHENDQLHVRLQNIPVLQKELDTARQECQVLKKDRNAFILRSQQMRRDREALRAVIEHLRVEHNIAESVLELMDKHADSFRGIARPAYPTIRGTRPKSRDAEAIERGRYDTSIPGQRSLTDPAIRGAIPKRRDAEATEKGRDDTRVPGQKLPTYPATRGTVPKRRDAEAKERGIPEQKLSTYPAIRGTIPKKRDTGAKERGRDDTRVPRQKLTTYPATRGTIPKRRDAEATGRGRYDTGVPSRKLPTDPAIRGAIPKRRDAEATGRGRYDTRVPGKKLPTDPAIHGAIPKRRDAEATEKDRDDTQVPGEKLPTDPAIHGAIPKRRDAEAKEDREDDTDEQELTLPTAPGEASSIAKAIKDILSRRSKRKGTDREAK